MSGDTESLVLLVFAAIIRRLPPHQVGPYNIVHLVQPDAEEEVEYQNDYERQYERSGCCSANALRTGRTIKSAITTHNSNRRAEKYALKHAVKQVPVVDELLRVVPVVKRI